MKKKYFPIFTDISGYKIIMIGADELALHRIEVLLEFTEQVTVIALEALPQFLKLEAEGKIVLKCKAYEREDILDADMVLTALQDETVNKDVYSACRCMGILVNVANDRAKCDFHFPQFNGEGLCQKEIS